MRARQSKVLDIRIDVPHNETACRNQPCADRLADGDFARIVAGFGRNSTMGKGLAGGLVVERVCAREAV